MTKKNKWLDWKKKWLQFKEGFQAYTDINLLEYFNFDAKWADDIMGQKKLEYIRQFQATPFEFESKRFAQLYTRKFKMYRFKNTQKVALEDYVERDFFNSVVLYGSIRNIFSFIADEQDYTSTDEIYSYLTKFINHSLDRYFRRKKKKKSLWNKLSKPLQIQLIDQIIFSLIANFKSREFKVLTTVNKSVFNEKSRKYEIRAFIAAHPQFDRRILGEYPIFIHDLPCVFPPQKWHLIGSNVQDGGYYTYNVDFIHAKPFFVGESVPTKRLIDLVNALQQTPWSVDPVSYNSHILGYDFSNLIKYLQEDVKKIRREEDILQKLNTFLFLLKFCPQFKKFYYVFNIDARGRLYSTADWGFSPTASKHIRKVIKLPNAEPLNEDGKKWLYLKIGRIQKIKAKNYKELLNNVIKKPIPNLDEIDVNQIKGYDSYRIFKIYNDIENGLSDEIMGLDCTTSAYQHIALVTRSQSLAESTNLTGGNSDEGGPESTFEHRDFYGEITDACKNNLPHITMKALLKRELMKPLVLPLCYGKQQESSTADIREYIYKNKKIQDKVLELQDDILLEVFKELVLPDKETDFEYYRNSKIYYYALWFYRHFRETFETQHPEFVQLKEVFKGKNAPLRNFKLNTPFIMFSNLYNTVEQYPIRKGKKEVKMTFNYVTDVTDSGQESRASLANFVHCLDAYLCHLILERCIAHGIKVISVHDNFLVHPKHINFLQEITRDSYNEIQDFLATIPELDIFRKNPPINIKSLNILKLD